MNKISHKNKHFQISTSNQGIYFNDTTTQYAKWTTPSVFNVRLLCLNLKKKVFFRRGYVRALFVYDPRTVYS